VAVVVHTLWRKNSQLTTPPLATFSTRCCLYGDTVPARAPMKSFAQVLTMHKPKPPALTLACPQRLHAVLYHPTHPALIADSVQVLLVALPQHCHCTANTAGAPVGQLRHLAFMQQTSCQQAIKHSLQSISPAKKK